LLEVTERVIDDAVARGPVVLVGRGAQSYLAQRSDALHVFCYAPKPALVARVVQREGISAEEAARRVDETNKRREQYVRRYWQRSWTSPDNYHLCVNTDWLGIDGAADLIAQVAKERLV
jgi:cytidylate kinase